MKRLSRDIYTLHCDGPGCDEFAYDDDAGYQGWSESYTNSMNGPGTGRSKSPIWDDNYHLCPHCQEDYCRECAEPLDSGCCVNEDCRNCYKCDKCGEYMDQYDECSNPKCEESPHFRPKKAYRTYETYCDGVDCYASYSPGYDEEPEGWLKKEYAYGDNLDLCPDCQKEHCPNCLSEREQYTLCPRCTETNRCDNCGNYVVDEFGNCQNEKCRNSQKCSCCTGELTSSNRCTDYRCPAYHNPYSTIDWKKSMKQSSVIVCPICGGPTHLSRDTGDFTCDHCGKIVVRAYKNNWINSMFYANHSNIPKVVIAADFKQSFYNSVKDAVKRGWSYNNVQGVHRFIYKGAPSGTKQKDKVVDVNQTNEAGISFFDNPTWKNNLERSLSRIEKLHGSLSTPDAKLPNYSDVWGSKETEPKNNQQRSNNGYQNTRVITTPGNTPQVPVNRNPYVENVEQDENGLIKSLPYHQVTVMPQKVVDVNSPQNYNFYNNFNIVPNSDQEHEETTAPENQSELENEPGSQRKKYIRGYQHGRASGLIYHLDRKNTKYDNTPCDYCIVGGKFKKDVDNINAGRRVNKPSENILRKTHDILTTNHEDQDDPEAFANVIAAWDDLPGSRKNDYRRGAASLGLPPITANKKQVTQYLKFIASKYELES